MEGRQSGISLDRVAREIAESADMCFAGWLAATVATTGSAVMNRVWAVTFAVSVVVTAAVHLWTSGRERCPLLQPQPRRG